MLKTNKINCPNCHEREIELKPVDGKPGRVEGYCICNPRGPVIETDAPASNVTAPARALPSVEGEK